MPPSYRIAVLLALLQATACTHTVVIQSTQQDAYVHVDGRILGQAPVRFKESVGLGEQYMFAVTAPGHRPYYLAVTQTSVNPQAHLAGLVSSVPIGYVALAAVLGGANPIITGIVSAGLWIYLNQRRFQLADLYVLPLGMPGEDALSQEFLDMNRRSKVPLPVTQPAVKPCAALFC